MELATSKADRFVGLTQDPNEFAEHCYGHGNKFRVLKHFSRYR
jgi:hypothetical protein